MLKFLDSLREAVMPYTVRAALGLTRRPRARRPRDVDGVRPVPASPFRNDLLRP